MLYCTTGSSFSQPKKIFKNCVWPQTAAGSTVHGGEQMTSRLDLAPRDYHIKTKTKKRAQGIVPSRTSHDPRCCLQRLHPRQLLFVHEQTSQPEQTGTLTVESSEHEANFESVGPKLRPRIGLAPWARKCRTSVMDGCGWQRRAG